MIKIKGRPFSARICVLYTAKGRTKSLHDTPMYSGVAGAPSLRTRAEKKATKLATDRKL